MLDAVVCTVNDEDIGHTGVENPHMLEIVVDDNQLGAEKHTHWQHCFQFFIYTRENFLRAETLGSHRAKDFGNRHRTERGEQPMTGEVPCQEEQVT
jgi:hypothetical protein